MKAITDGESSPVLSIYKGIYQGTYQGTYHFFRKTNFGGFHMKEKTKKRSIGNIIVTVILVICILLAIFAGYSAFASKAGGGVPSILGIRPFAVQSDSMAPTFYKGDLVIDKAVKDPAALEKGDVITFWTIINGQKVLNTHRIVNVTDYGNYLYFDTKGDNNPVEDTTGVHQNDIVGQYMFKISNVGTVLDFLQTSLGFGVCIVLPVAIFFLYELISFFRTLMAYKTERVRMELQSQMNGTVAAAPAAQKVEAKEAQVEAPEQAETVRAQQSED